MTSLPGELEARLDAVFGRIFGRDHEPGSRPAAGDLPTWDSLGHVTLVMEIEVEFGLRVDGQTMLSLHRDFDTVLRWLTATLAMPAVAEETA